MLVHPFVHNQASEALWYNWFMPRLVTLLWILSCLLPTSARTAELDETADSAVWLLRKATLVHRDGRHNLLIRALRQMKDPALQPLFIELVAKPHPVLKIHGILGLGEISGEKNIDLARLADLEDPLAQAQLVSTALEAKLLTTEQCVQLLDWSNLDASVKVLVAAPLLADGRLKDASSLEKNTGASTPALRGMVALIKLQLGDSSALKSLEELNGIEDASRDAVRAMLMQTSLRYEFASAAPWAVQVADSGTTDRGLAFFALRVALHFKAPGAEEMWTRQFSSSPSPADRVRLSLLAVDMYDRLSAKAFELLQKEEDSLIRQCGLVGLALKSGGNSDEPLLGMLELNHLVAGQWVLQHVEKLKPEQARPVLVGVILAAEGTGNQDRYRAQRLENCVFAAQRLVETDPESHEILTHLIQSSPELTQEAVLMGLIKADTGDAARFTPTVADLKSDTARSLALLLKAKSPGVKLTTEEMKGLELIVRGGAGLQETLRIQAAWTYLKLTQQDKVALANVLSP